MTDVTNDVEVVVPTANELSNVNAIEFTKYVQEKIDYLKEKTEFLLHEYSRMNRMNLVLNVPQMIINAGMTSSVLFEYNSDNLDTSKHLIIGLGVVNVVLQSFSNSFKYGNKSQKAKEKSKACQRLLNELQLCQLVKQPSKEYKEEIINRIVSSGLC